MLRLDPKWRVISVAAILFVFAFTTGPVYPGKFSNHCKDACNSAREWVWDYLQDNALLPRAAGDGDACTHDVKMRWAGTGSGSYGGAWEWHTEKLRPDEDLWVGNMKSVRRVKQVITDICGSRTWDDVDSAHRICLDACD